MINILLTRAEALLIVELVNKAHDSLTQALIIGVEEENAKDEVARAAKNNYVSNLEMEVKRLEEETSALKAAQNAPKLKVRIERAKPEQTQETTKKRKAKTESLWVYCDSKIKNMKRGQTRILSAPSFTTYEKFRHYLSLVATQKYKGQFKTKANKTKQTVSITKLKEDK